MSDNSSIVTMQNPTDGFLGNIITTDNKNLVWIELDVYTLNGQSTGGRYLPTLDKRVNGFRFLAPNEITETLTHEYNNYDSIASRTAEASEKLNKIGKEASGLAEAVKEGTTELSLGTGTEVVNKTPVNYARPDISLVYQNTNRRSIEFTFMLYECGNSLDNIVKVVRTLQSYSSPQKEGQLEKILPPHIFNIKTIPNNDLFLLNNAVLMSVQYTFKAPYISVGLPSSCELTLSFQGLPPVFNDSFNSPKIKVGSVGGS